MPYRRSLLVPMTIMLLGVASCASVEDSGAAPGRVRAGVVGAACDEATPCEGAELCCAGVCADPASDGANCGACGTTCAGATTCLGGACGCADPALAQCGDACVDVTTDTANCGACGTACAGATTCLGGACGCADPGLAQCGDACVDVTTDTANCGACGSACPGGAACVGGACEGPASIVKIANGVVTACALMSNGTVRCAGGGASLGEGPGVPDRTTPGAAVPGLSNVTDITIGQEPSGNLVCALLADGTVQCWAAGYTGGAGTTGARFTPTVVCAEAPCVAGSPPLSGVAQVAVGSNQRCARLVDGTVRCWGYNPWGSVGDGTTTSRPAPTVVPGLSGVVEVASGVNHTCARLDDGTVKCWGDNRSGQLGDGTLTPRYSPTVVSGLTDVAEISLGSTHSCARLNDGTVRCWGENRGQLGLGFVPSTPRPNPTEVPGLAGVVGLALGSQFTCARLVDGSAQCWGRNESDTLGIQPGTYPLPSPVCAGLEYPCRAPTVADPVGGPWLSSVVQLAAGRTGVCALLADGGTRCWGGNDVGHLGVGPFGSPARPRLALW